MPLPKKIKFYFFPILFLILPGIFGIYLEIFNRYYRGVETPFFFPALGLLLISLFFWVKKRWLYFSLILVMVVFLVFFFKNILFRKPNSTSVVYYYGEWSLNSQTGLIKLKKPLGKHPPSSGSYISCNFNLTHWKNYFNTQPILCTAFDPKLRLKLLLNDQEDYRGTIREIQINYFKADRKSLLGEPLDRWALRIAYLPEKEGIFPRFKIKAIYQVYEQEIKGGKTRIVETFSRDSEGKLKTFTESPSLKFSQGDVYALYDPDGNLVEIPNMKRRSFSFPAHIDTRRYKYYSLPERIKPEN